MKVIQLAMPTSVGSDLRTPMDGSFAVSDAEAERLRGLSLLDGEPEACGEASDAGELRNPS
jgi:hypothetical protein